VPKHASWLNRVEIEIGVLGQPMSRPAHRRCRHAASRDRGLGGGAERRRRTHPVDVHGRTCAREAGACRSAVGARPEARDPEGSDSEGGRL